MAKEELLTMEELSKYLADKPAKWTIYGWIRDGKIPYIKRGKKNFFEKSVIDTWENNGRPPVIDLNKIIDQNDHPIKSIE